MELGVTDFFCGCGGTSAGLQKAGFKILAGIDIDQVALKTFKANFRKAKTFSNSISELEVSKIQEMLKASGCERHLFAACAPCQPFSSQNKGKGSSDKRSSLLDEFHRFVRACKPDYILLENVPGMQKIQEGPFTRFIELLTELGYNFDFDVKDAKKYGVPQTRRRLVLLASLHEKVTLPAPTHGKENNLVPYKTVWESISKYPRLKAGGKSRTVPNHECTQISEINIKRLEHTPEGGDRRDWPKRLLLDCHKEYAGHTDTYGRMRKDQPSATLTTKCVSISNGRFGHPSQNRAISVREAAALQTFDDNFVFKGTLAQAARHVGNAVPVLFAEALGHVIINQLGIESRGKLSS